MGLMFQRYQASKRVKHISIYDRAQFVRYLYIYFSIVKYFRRQQIVCRLKITEIVNTTKNAQRKT